MTLPNHPISRPHSMRFVGTLSMGWARDVANLMRGFDDLHGQWQAAFWARVRVRWRTIEAEAIDALSRVADHGARQDRLRRATWSAMILDDTLTRQRLALKQRQHHVVSSASARSPPERRRTRGKRRNFSPTQTDVLETWFRAHARDPYPGAKDKLKLAQATGLSVRQVANWFINGRARAKCGFKRIRGTKHNEKAGPTK